MRSRLRVGDRSRDLAVGVLKRAYAKGLLSLDDFESRTAAAYAATTRGDLRPLLEDLPEYQAVRANRRMWPYWLD